MTDNNLPVAASEIRPVSMGMLQANTPAELLQVARTIADPLKDLILELGLFQKFGDKTHVEVEGWTTMLSMLGIMPQQISVERVPCDVEGYGDIYIATTGLVRIEDQKMICSASAECGGVDEPNWHIRKGKPVPGNQRRSMAITRSVGKASRLGFSWIMVLAGYSPTPLEEMPQDDQGRYHNIDHSPEFQPRPMTGRNPRDDMGHKNDPKMSKPPVEKKKPVVKEAVAQTEFVCKICGISGKSGQDIAVIETANGKRVAHKDCYLDSLLDKD